MLQPSNGEKNKTNTNSTEALKNPPGNQTDSVAIQAFWLKKVSIALRNTENKKAPKLSYV